MLISYAQKKNIFPILLGIVLSSPLLPANAWSVIVECHDFNVPESMSGCVPMTGVGIDKIWVPIAGDITFFIPIERESSASRATIAGIDEDNNGIRDNVQSLIYKKYESNTYLRTLSLTIAKKLQQIVAQSLTSAQVNQRLVDIGYANSCALKNSADPATGNAFVFPEQLILPIKVIL